MWTAYQNRPACAGSGQKYTNELQPYGRIVPVRPGHHKAVLKRPGRILYEDEVDLASGLLHGPINYERDCLTLSELACLERNVSKIHPPWYRHQQCQLRRTTLKIKK
jgi:hypothetical protein